MRPDPDPLTVAWVCDWKPDEFLPGPECPYCAGDMCGRFDGLGCTHNREERHGYKPRRPLRPNPTELSKGLPFPSLGLLTRLWHRIWSRG